MQGHRLQVFVEDWSARYGSPYLVSPDDGSTGVAAQLIEDGSELRSHAPTGGPTDRLAFVDGVRRMEATMYLSDGDAFAHGIAGSHACGAAIVDGPARMAIDHVRVARLAIFGAGVTTGLPPVDGFSWRSSSVADTEPDAPLNDLQTRMRQQEGILAEELAADGRLVIVDGPLSFVRSRDLPVVGHIKTHRRVLLAPGAHQKVPGLRAGERTSLFTLGSDRYSCYLRLAAPGESAGPWSGIVRIEVPQSAGIAEAVRTADAVAAALPRYAGVPWRDPRAPQNLQPVGALERYLQHSLGDSRLAARAVRAAVAELRRRTEDAA
jgi:hypothetical protein